MSKWAFFREIIIQAYIVILYSHYVFKTCVMTRNMLAL